MTNYFKNKILQDNLVTKKVYLALFNGEKEVGATSYERVKIDFLNPVDGQITNRSDLYFNVAAGTWGTISHIGIYDEGDNLLYFGPAEIEKEINISDQYKIPKSYLIIRID